MVPLDAIATGPAASPYIQYFFSAAAVIAIVLIIAAFFRKVKR